MPVIIREIRINIDVSDTRVAEDSDASTLVERLREEKKAIISQCIEEVIELIQEKKER